MTTILDTLLKNNQQVNSIDTLTHIFSSKKPEPIQQDEYDEEEQEEEHEQQNKQENKKNKKKQMNELTEERKKNTIFVGNIKLESSKKRVKEHFSRFGKIVSIWERSLPTQNTKTPQKAKVILKEFIEGQDNKNMYIYYEQEQSAIEALSMNNSELDGHKIRVDRAFVKQQDTCQTLFIGNLPFDITENKLREQLQKCGEIEYVRLIRDKSTHKGKGIGYVCFKDQKGYQEGLKMNMQLIEGRKIRVKKAVEKKRIEKKQRQREKIVQQKQDTKLKFQQVNKSKRTYDSNIFKQKGDSQKGGKSAVQKVNKKIKKVKKGKKVSKVKK